MAQRLYAPFQQLRRRLALSVRKLQQAAEYDPPRDDLHGPQGSFLRSFQFLVNGSAGPQPGEEPLR